MHVVFDFISPRVSFKWHHLSADVCRTQQTFLAWVLVLLACVAIGLILSAQEFHCMRTHDPFTRVFRLS